MSKAHYLILGILLSQNVRADVGKRDERENSIQAARMQEIDTFFKACANGDEQTVRTLIEAKIDVNQTKCGWTALHHAAYHGHRGVAEQLLAAGADVDALNNKGQNPLYWAVKRGDIALVKILLKAGADLNIRFPVSRGTVLDIALSEGSAEMARILLEESANLGHCHTAEDCSETCYIPYYFLLWAISSNQIEMVRMLLALGADVNYVDMRGVTHLHTAAAGGNVEIVKMLLAQGAHVNYPIKNAGDDVRYVNGEVPIHWAAELHHAEVIKILLQASAHVDVLNDRGETPLQLAIQEEPPSTTSSYENDENGNILHSPETNTDSAFEDNLERIIELLIIGGANINTLDQHNSTLLHVARCQRAVLVLLKKGLNIDTPDRFSRTPLHRAVSRGDTSVVKALIDAGANVNARDEDGSTPLHKADSYFVTKEILERLVEAGADPNAQNIKGNTPLHNIIQHRNGYNGDKSEKTIRLLLKLGAYINAQNSQGQTPLDLYLIETAKKIDWAYSADNSFIRYLKSNGAEIGALVEPGCDEVLLKSYDYKHE